MNGVMDYRGNPCCEFMLERTGSADVCLSQDCAERFLLSDKYSNLRYGGTKEVQSECIDLEAP